MKFSTDFISFFGFWAINAIIIFLAQATVKSQVVVGNIFVPWILSLVITSLTLTILISAIMPFLKVLKIEAKNELFLGILYLIVNIGAIWLLARAAQLTGFGIASYLVAVILGIILNIIQYGFWKFLTVYLKKD